jgi:CRP/FNR family cyclic AMP-dependent transcriptional regulator
MLWNGGLVVHAHEAPPYRRFTRTPGGDAGRRIAPLLDLDPDLGRYLSPEGVSEVRRTIAVRVASLKRGTWDVDRLPDAGSGHLGLLIVDGLLGRELLAADVASMELLGPGDLLRPWDDATDVGLLQAVVRWSVFSDTRLAILDRELAARLARHPEIYTALMERMSSRARRLAVMQAIAQLNRVDRRVLTLLWHLAERWGRVTPNGVVVPLALSHRSLAQLVGARRPTVSTAIGELTREGELRRGDAGTWILTGAPAGAPDEMTSHFVLPRRAMWRDPADEVGVAG